MTGGEAGVRVDQPRTAEDWAEIRRICCSTARAGGNPIEPARWDFFGEFWIAPYRKLRPEWAYVLRSESSGRILGYLTAAPDTRRFEWERALRVRFPLIFKLLFKLLLWGRSPWSSDVLRFLRRAFRWEEAPEARFSRETHQRLSREFPAHLHINLDAEARGRGWGGWLVERLLRDLERKGVPGVHLYCAAGPVKFYRSQGFETLEMIEFAPGVPVYAMVRKMNK